MHRHGGVTRAVENYIKAKTQGMWTRLPKSVDTTKVVQAFQKFAARVKGLSPRLTDHGALVKYLLLISPSFSLQKDPNESSSHLEDDAFHDEAEPVNEEGEGPDEIVETDGGAENRLPRRRSGKELRRTANAGDEDIDGENIDESQLTAEPARRRQRGKELRKQAVEAEEENSFDEEIDEDEESDEEISDEEIFEVERPSQRGKELRRRRQRQPIVLDVEDSERGSLSDEDGSSGEGEGPMDQQDSNAGEDSGDESNVDVFENRDLFKTDEGGADDLLGDEVMEGLDE